MLAEELAQLGAVACRQKPTGVWFEGDLEIGYRAVLWSRVANRIYLSLHEAQAEGPDDVYAAASQVDWSEQMTVDTPFSVSFTGQGAGVRHTHFGALKIKDAIVDQFRSKTGRRPSVMTEGARLAIHAHLHRGRLQLFLDLSGYGLHQRGYRAGVKFVAPLKENVAAAILLRCRWPQRAAAGEALVDPMCGSGTFLAEGAWMAQRRAPQLMQIDRMAFLQWLGHVPALWRRLTEEAQACYAAHRDDVPLMEGRDVSVSSLAACRQALHQAGVADKATLRQASVAAQRGVGGVEKGLVVCNPPYGERLGTASALDALYAELGQLLRTHFVGWTAGVFTCREDKASLLGLKPEKSHRFRNGALACRLFRYRLAPEAFRPLPLELDRQAVEKVRRRYPDMAQTSGAQMFANRLRKNLRRLRRWLKREEICAFRAYDADMPEYALAVDVYDTEDDGRWAVAYEYAPPASVSPRKARRRLFEALSVLPEALETSAERIVYKVRQRQKGARQYEKLDLRREFHRIRENGAHLWVNFHDYLDTGVFLDHRQVRRRLAQWSRGKRLLNLFCYTATASVEAVAAGAERTVSVDLSRTYLTWARKNFALNGIETGTAHELIQADVLQWLAQSARRRERFDVIFLDPPSFSTSSRMTGTLDIQRDHVRLIERVRPLLAPGGALIFSTNLRRFRLDEAVRAEWRVEDWTQATLPPDFARNPKIHQVWMLTL